MLIYYANAIRRNSDNVKEMKKAILATFYHKISTDKKPQHKWCPTGVDSWCEWQKAKANKQNMKHFEHPPALDPKVQIHLLPIYEDLTRDELLQRCLGGHTQNANECFNSTI